MCEGKGVAGFEGCMCLEGGRCCGCLFVCLLACLPASRLEFLLWAEMTRLL